MDILTNEIIRSILELTAICMGLIVTTCALVFFLKCERDFVTSAWIGAGCLGFLMGFIGKTCGIWQIEIAGEAVLVLVLFAPVFWIYCGGYLLAESLKKSKKQKREK